MVKLMHLVGWYFGLDDVGEFFSVHCEHIESHKRLMEIWATWVLAKLMQSRNNAEYVVGFATHTGVRETTLGQIIIGETPTIDEDFDTLIAEQPKGHPYYRIQVKQYRPSENEPEEFVQSLVKTLSHYAPDATLNLIYWFRGGLRLPLTELGKAFDERRFAFGGLYFAGARKQDGQDIPVIYQIYPNENGRVYAFEPV